MTQALRFSGIMPANLLPFRPCLHPRPRAASPSASSRAGT